MFWSHIRDSYKSRIGKWLRVMDQHGRTTQTDSWTDGQTDNRWAEMWNCETVVWSGSSNFTFVNWIFCMHNGVGSKLVVIKDYESLILIRQIKMHISYYILLVVIKDYEYFNLNPAPTCEPFLCMYMAWCLKSVQRKKNVLRWTFCIYRFTAIIYFNYPSWSNKAKYISICWFCCKYLYDYDALNTFTGHIMFFWLRHTT